MEKSLQERIEHSARLLKKYPDRIPLIIEKSKHVTLDNYKYLLPNTITASTFMNIIKKKINIAYTQALFTFIKSNNEYVLIPMNETMDIVYDLYKQDDGFLYIRFGIENTFGF